MKINEIISENMSGCFAGVTGALGAGDPSASIYAKKPAKKNKTKPKMGYSDSVGNLVYNRPVKTPMIKR